MSRIDDLIAQLCPDGVGYIKLGEIARVLRGKRLTKSQLSSDNKYPVYHGGLEPLGYYCKNNRRADSVMVINVGASAGTVGYSTIDFWSSDGCSFYRDFVGRANAKWVGGFRKSIPLWNPIEE